MRPLLALLVLATPAFADPLLTAEEFDALTLGRTMSWSEQGTVYGFEQYLPGRKVRWTFVGDECKDGTWYQQGDAICFQYEGDPAPDCWTITRSDPDLLAQYTTSPPDTPPVVVSATTEPLACFGPKVGV